LVTADSKQLEKRGIEVNMLLGFLFVPAYLYRRAKLTSTSQTGLIIWSGALVASLMISLLGSMFVGSQASTDATETAIKSWLVESFITDDSVLIRMYLTTVLQSDSSTIQAAIDRAPSLSASTEGGYKYSYTMKNRLKQKKQQRKHKYSKRHHKQKHLKIDD
jgi:hypothetical protein